MQTFQIRLQGTADTRQWVQAQGVLRSLDGEAKKFVDSLRAGVGIDLGGRMVNTLGRIPDIFTSILTRGFEFNKKEGDSEIAIANVIQKFQKLDAVAARNEAAKAMKEIIRLEPESAATQASMVQGLLATIGAGQSAGVEMMQNIKLVGKFANALANAALPADQLKQELAAVFTGNITMDATLAKILRITPAMVKAGEAAGNLGDVLEKAVGSMGEAGDSAGVALSTLDSAVDTSLGILSKPLFNSVIQGSKDLAQALKDPVIIDQLERLGVDIGKLVDRGLDLTKWVFDNSTALLALADALVKVGAVMAAIKIASLVAGLARQAAMWGTNTVAVQANTAALATNTVAAAANATARQAAAAVPAALVGPATAGGTVAGTAAAAGFGGAFARALPSIMNTLGLGAIITAVLYPATKFALAQIEDDFAKEDARRFGALGKPSNAARVQAKLDSAVTPEQRDAARVWAASVVAILASEIAEHAANNDTVGVALNDMERKTILNLIRNFDQRVASSGTDTTSAAEAVAKAQEEFNRQLDLFKAKAGDTQAELNALQDAYDSLRERLGKELKVDLSGVQDINEILAKLTPETLQGDNASKVNGLLEQIAEAYDKVKAKARELEEQERSAAQATRQLETDLLELKIRALEAAGNKAAATNARVLLEARQLAEALFGSGAFDSFEEALKQATGVIQQERAAEAKAEEEKVKRAREVAELEDQINRARAEGNDKLARELEDRLKILQLTRQIMESEKRSAEEAGKIARERVANERAAGDAARGGGAAGRGLDDAFRRRAEEVEREGRGTGKVTAAQAEARRNAARDRAAAGRDAGFGGLREFYEKQKTPLRDTFRFPSLDGFDRMQNDPNRRRPVSSVPVSFATRDGAAPGQGPGNAVQAVDTNTNALTETHRATQQQLAQVTQRLSNVSALIVQQGRANSENMVRLQGELQKMETTLRREIVDAQSRMKNNRT